MRKSFGETLTQRNSRSNRYEVAEDEEEEEEEKVDHEEIELRAEETLDAVFDQNLEVREEEEVHQDE